MNIEAACAYIDQKLEAELPADLYYHGVHHTRDVVRTALKIAEREAIPDAYSLQILKVAASFHDAGFLHTYQGHEEESCSIAQSVLPRYGFGPVEIGLISGMIMATKIPQTPTDSLSKILCDADLDYLGRDDFDPIAASLFEELKARGIVQEVAKWDQVQVKFLSEHRYWTQSESRLRDQKKAQHLEKLINGLRQEPS